MQSVERMQTLYTKHVVTDTARRLFNLGLGRLAHVVARGVNPAQARTGVVMNFARYFVEERYVVDEKPTLSRMFTYRGCVDNGLAMHLHDSVRHCFKLKTINPRPQNLKRSTKVQLFFRDPDNGQYLRRTSLAMQITGGVTALVCPKDDAHCSEAKSTVGFAACAEMSRPATSGAGGGPPDACLSGETHVRPIVLGQGPGSCEEQAHGHIGAHGW